MEEKLGKSEAAAEYYRLATLGAMEVAGMMYYYDQPADMILYQGWAKEKLGEKKEANARFYRLIDFGEHHIRDIFRMDYFAVSMPDFTIFDEDMTRKNEAHCWYVMGLGKLGLGRNEDFDEDMTRKNEAHCWYVMGLGKLGLGRNEEAAEDLKKVLELDPSHQNAMLYLKMAEYGVRN